MTQRPEIGSVWVEFDRGHWPMDVVKVWAVQPDYSRPSEDLQPSDSFYRGVVAFEIIEGRNGPTETEGEHPQRCRRLWPLPSFLVDFEPK